MKIAGPALHLCLSSVSQSVNYLIARTFEVRRYNSESKPGVTIHSPLCLMCRQNESVHLSKSAMISNTQPARADPRISTRAPHAGCNPLSGEVLFSFFNFNPCTPRGVQHQKNTKYCEFLSNYIHIQQVLRRHDNPRLVIGGEKRNYWGDFGC